MKAPNARCWLHHNQSSVREIHDERKAPRLLTSEVRPCARVCVTQRHHQTVAGMSLHRSEATAGAAASPDVIFAAGVTAGRQHLFRHARRKFEDSGMRSNQSHPPFELW